MISQYEIMREVALKIHYEQDVDIALVKAKRVAIIGYGSQGHAHAQNLRDTGVSVIVAEPGETPAAIEARGQGFEVMTASQAAAHADVVMMLVPDELQADIYRDELASAMKQGAALGFAHGFNIHYGLIRARKDLDVFMVAPKAPGHTVRWEYERGAGVPCLVAVGQDASGNADELALSYAGAIGGGRAGIIRTTFAEETETDLFGEQVVLCGGLFELLQAGFETLTEAGYAPEMAYFECVHELKLIVDMVTRDGLSGMRASGSNTAEYGDYTRGPRLITQETRREMRVILEEIRNGKFATEWMTECRAGQPSFEAMRRRARAHPVEDVGNRLRGMMPWLRADH
jgi:ketol-acid reductoisomerase